jgi:hypothetical protein
MEPRRRRCPLPRFVELAASRSKSLPPRAPRRRATPSLPLPVVGRPPERRRPLQVGPTTMVVRRRPVSGRFPSLPPPVSRPTRSPRSLRFFLTYPSIWQPRTPAPPPPRLPPPPVRASDQRKKKADDFAVRPLPFPVTIRFVLVS